MLFRIALLLSLAAATGCTSNLSRFDVINETGGVASGKLQVTRAETADQGSGDAALVIGPGGHTLMRTTVGGHYARRLDSKAGSAGYQLSAGLHGNPRAKQ